jgi:hypothetical protein
MMFIHNGINNNLLLQWKNWIWLFGIMLAEVAADIHGFQDGSKE